MQKNMDFDAYADSIRDVDCVMLFKKTQHRFCKITHITLPRVHFQLGRLGGGNIVEGKSWPGGYLLYFPLTDTCTYLANGIVLKKYSFVIMEPGCDFCISTNVEHEWCMVFIPAQPLDHNSGLVVTSSGSKKRVCRVTHADCELAQQFLAIVFQIMNVARNSQFEAWPTETCAEMELLKVASLIVGQQQRKEPHQEGRPKLPRQEIIRRFKAIIEEKRNEPIHIDELSTAIGVSERTLRTAFNEYYGMGPCQYLQLRQIHQVHCILKAADPAQESVTNIILRSGQEELGRFATRYRQIYDELPSETLQKKL